MMVIKQGSDIWIDNEFDIATASAIAPIRSTEGFEFFTVYRNAPVSPLAGYGVERYTINECCHCRPLALLGNRNRIVKIKERVRIHGPLIYENRELGDRDHIYNATTASATEFDCACSHCEESVILTPSNVCTWMEMRAALAYEDLTILDYLSAESLNSKVLRIGVATVSCR
jgi:hypothetical protein